MTVFKALNFEPFCKGIMPDIIREVERLGDPTPQAVFFMLAPAYLGILEPQKRTELYSGLLRLDLHGEVPHEVFENFVNEMKAADRGGPLDWVKEAIVDADLDRFR